MDELFSYQDKKDNSWCCQHLELSSGVYVWCKLRCTAKGRPGSVESRLISCSRVLRASVVAAHRPPLCHWSWQVKVDGDTWGSGTCRTRSIIILSSRFVVGYSSGFPTPDRPGRVNSRLISFAISAASNSEFTVPAHLDSPVTGCTTTCQGNHCNRLHFAVVDFAGFCNWQKQTSDPAPGLALLCLGQSNY